MRRLCIESSCPYPGRSVSLAVRVPMGVELRASSKGLELPSNPKGAVVATGAGLRAGAKALEVPPDPKVMPLPTSLHHLEALGLDTGQRRW